MSSSSLDFAKAKAKEVAWVRDALPQLSMYLILDRTEDFNKAKAVAISAGKSGAYLYPIKVSTWDCTAVRRLELNTDDDRASSTFFHIVTCGKLSQIIHTAASYLIPYIGNRCSQNLFRPWHSLLECLRSCLYSPTCRRVRLDRAINPFSTIDHLSSVCTLLCKWASSRIHNSAVDSQWKFNPHYSALEEFLDRRCFGWYIWRSLGVQEWDRCGLRGSSAKIRQRFYQ